MSYLLDSPNDIVTDTNGKTLVLTEGRGNGIFGERHACTKWDPV